MWECGEHISKNSESIKSFCESLLGLQSARVNAHYKEKRDDESLKLCNRVIHTKRREEKREPSTIAAKLVDCCRLDTS